MPDKTDHSLKLLQTVLDHLPSGVSLTESDLNISLWNNEFKRLLEFPDELLGNDPSIYSLSLFNARRGEYGAGDPEEIAHASEERARKMEAHTFERTRPGGTVLEIRGRPLPGGGFVSIYTDITDRKRAENEVRRTATFLQAVLDNLPFGVMVLDRQVNCIYWNQQSEELFDFPPGFIYRGIPVLDILRKVAANGIYGTVNVEQQVMQRMKIIASFQAHQVELTCPNGRYLRVLGAPVHIGDDTVGMVLLQEDITERRNDQATLERLATTDPLTGLLNRRAYLDTTEQEVRRAHRYGQSLSMLMLDVDHFKRINDRYGHPAGDEVLRQIAQTCCKHLRDEDITGRLGGEEFAITLIQAPLRSAMVVAERLRKAIEALVIEHEGRKIQVTVSIGATEYGPATGEIGRLISRADELLYQAKASGRNRVCADSHHGQ